MDDLVRHLIAHYIYRSVKNWGLEGTEQKIKELYKNNPCLRHQYLSVFYDTYPSLNNKKIF